MGPVEAESVGSGVGANAEAGVGKEAEEAGGGAEASVEAQEGRSGMREGDTPHLSGVVSTPHASRQPVSICVRGWPAGAATRRHGDIGTFRPARGGCTSSVYSRVGLTFRGPGGGWPAAYPL